MKNVIKNLSKLFLLFLFVCLTPNVKALSATFASKSTTIYIGNSSNISVYITGISGSVQSAGGYIGIADSSCVRINSIEKVKANDVNANKFAYVDFGGSGAPNGLSFVNVNVTGLKKCSTRLTVSDPSIGDNNGDITPNISMGTITVTDAPSGNTGLKSLSISTGTLSPSFSSSNTDYSVSVANDVGEISISATPDDSGAKISGIGTKTLDFGDNKIEVVVTAPSGASKTYTITVNRADSRNNDNTLSTLSVDGFKISPTFDSNVTDYTLTIPYNFLNLTVNAKANNDLSTVEIVGNEDLVAGQTKNVTITVTAENQSKKVYTIAVTVTANTYLKSITLNDGKLYFTNGKLVKNFDKQIKKYYYKDGNDFSYSAEAEDSNNTVKTLKDGNTIYFVVEAPNGEMSVYTLEEYHKSTLEKMLIFIIGICVGVSSILLYQKVYRKRKNNKKRENNFK